MCESAVAYALKSVGTILVPPGGGDDYALMAAALDEKFKELADALVAGDITPEQWMSRFHFLLVDGHTDAHLIGQVLGSGGSSQIAMARQIGAYMAGTERQYMQGFVLDLMRRDPRYFDEDSGDWRPDTIHNRMRLYLGKTRGTAGKGFVDGSPAGSEFDWETAFLEHHCADCPIIADGSPYTIETLYTTPGAGQTPCFGNCQCRIVRTDGVVGIDPLQYSEEPGDGPPPKYESPTGDDVAGQTEEEPHQMVKLPRPQGTLAFPIPDDMPQGEFYERIRGLDREVIGAYRDGKPVFEPWKGQKSQVHVPMPNVIDLSGTDVIHNHPGSSIFSQEDMQIASVLKVGRMIVVRRRGGQWVATAPEGWPAPSRCPMAEHRAAAEAQKQTDAWRRTQESQGVYPSLDVLQDYFQQIYERTFALEFSKMGVIMNLED